MREDPTSRLEPGRLIAISDGIFAVALTLLIIDVKPPDVEVSRLAGALVATAPRLGIFALSFAIVAYYWVVHHLLFVFVRNVNRGLLWENLLFLFTIVVLPFSAAVLGRYPLAAPALVFYGVNVACCSLTLWLLWWHATRFGFLAHVSALQRRFIVLRFALSSSLALVGVALAAAAPLASLLLFLAVPLAHAVTSRSIKSARS